jgi:hypothetical protein
MFASTQQISEEALYGYVNFRQGGVMTMPVQLKVIPEHRAYRTG